MENTGAFAIVEVAFAFEASSVAGDGEFNVLLAGFGEIDSVEIAGGPIGLMIRIVVVAVIDERELDLAGFIAVGDGPAAGASFGGASDKGQD